MNIIQSCFTKNKANDLFCFKIYRYEKKIIDIVEEMIMKQRYTEKVKEMVRNQTVRINNKKGRERENNKEEKRGRDSECQNSGES